MATLSEKNKADVRAFTRTKLFALTIVFSRSFLISNSGIGRTSKKIQYLMIFQCPNVTITQLHFAFNCKKMTG